jgi:hypothetical protein
MVRDANEAVLFGRDFLGRSMTREQALKSPLLPEFFEIADFVVFNDPAVHSFLAGEAIDLGSRPGGPSFAFFAKGGVR